MLYFSIDETNIFNSMWLFTPSHFPPQWKGFVPSPLRKIVVKLRLLFSLIYRPLPPSRCERGKIIHNVLVNSFIVALIQNIHIYPEFKPLPLWGRACPASAGGLGRGRLRQSIA